jgi:hypothetical protein
MGAIVGLVWGAPIMVTRTMSAAALLVMACTVATPAQEIVDAVAGEPFQESYDPIPDASGGQLLGLRLLGGAEQVRGSGPLFLQPNTPAERVCVEAHTGDGRYSAANPFRIPVASASWVRIGALSQVHKQTLDGYDVGDIAVRSYVVSGDSCTAGDAVLLPASSGPGVRADALAVQVNAGGLTVGARLFALGADGQPMSEGVMGECGPAGGGARLGFNTVCRLALTDVTPGLAQLDIEFDDGFVIETVRHRVLLPVPVSQ